MIAAPVEPVSSTFLRSLDERTERLIERRRELDLQEVLWSRESADLAATNHYIYRHHRNVHEGGWQVVKSDGRLVTIAPPMRFNFRARGPD